MLGWGLQDLDVCKRLPRSFFNWWVSLLSAVCCQSQCLWNRNTPASDNNSAAIRFSFELWLTTCSTVSPTFCWSASLPSTIHRVTVICKSYNDCNVYNGSGLVVWIDCSPVSILLLTCTLDLCLGSGIYCWPLERQRERVPQFYIKMFTLLEIVKSGFVDCIVCWVALGILWLVWLVW